jgi:hypothetical protein
MPKMTNEIWIAFSSHGSARNLGKCGDYFDATLTADDVLGKDNWTFIMSTAELTYILQTIEGTTDA